MTVYECPTCGSLSDRTTCRGPLLAAHPRANGVAVRVFREEDVRPLWDALQAVPTVEPDRDILDGFPAPEEWR